MSNTMTMTRMMRLLSAGALVYTLSLLMLWQGVQRTNMIDQLPFVHRMNTTALAKSLRSPPQKKSSLLGSAARKEATTHEMLSAKKKEKEEKFVSSLRLDWTNLPPLSPLAKQIAKSQTKCFDSRSGNKPQEIYQHIMEEAGMGSSIHTWSQSLCHAVEHDKVLITTGHWEWRDRTRCPPLQLHDSPLSCYFGQHVSAAQACPTNTTKFVEPTVVMGPCDNLIKEHGRSGVRAAVMEWLFQNVTDIVVKEAEKQIHQMFNDTIMPSPNNLITVHIRWGDKSLEIPLLPVSVYIDAVKSLLRQEELDGSKPVHIYLATEDPNAKQQFSSRAEKLHWTVYSSGPTNVVNGEVHMYKVAMSTKGATGLDSLAALLVSLQANRYVLGTGSNWSRLINELRKAVLNPRCDNCTTWVNVNGDEAYGEW
jgi:hypothetical protein